MQDYRNGKIAVGYDPKICIHAGDCVRGLPGVFNIAKKPWVNIDGASPEAIAEQVKKCPSGALSFQFLKQSG